MAQSKDECCDSTNTKKTKLRNLHSHEILTSHQKMGVEKVPT